MTLLDVRELSVRFGGVVALDRVSFTVEAGEVVALIGPNGAGKTTLFNVITRAYRPSAGSVLADGEPAPRMSPPPHPQRAERDDAAGRAPHGLRDGHLRPRRRARLREEDR